MQNISRKTSIQINTSADQALPLFTAAGERLWIANWEPTYIYPLSGEPERGMIWKTNVDPATEAIWVTVDYDPAQGIATYLKWTPEKHVTRIDIRCEPLSEHQTVVHVTYTLTSLSEAGQTDLDKLTEEYYVAWIASWETALNHYLAHGEMLIPH